MKWWRRYLDWRQRNVTRVRLIEGGFETLSSGNRVEIRWDTIVTVTAYKRDLYMVDMLCILVQAKESAVEINEEMEGYEAVEVALQEWIDLPPEWKLGVLFPAFEANATTLFEREVAPA